MINKILKKIMKNKKSNIDMISLHAKSPKKGNVLLSYMKDYVLLDDSDLAFEGHTNKWESKAIADIFLDLGFDVDVIDYNNRSFKPKKKYNIVFDIHYNIDRLGYYWKKNTLKLLHITGSYPEYSIKKEIERTNELMNRKNIYYSPKRICDSVYFNRSLDFADRCSLIGNEHTLNTFPVEYHEKIDLVTVTASPSIRKDLKKNLGDEFLWFYGTGAVHKGLDLLLDIFSRRKDIRLNIVGDLAQEIDFKEIYQDELLHFDNIHYWGPQDTQSFEFQKIIDRCFCFIAPSCSEAISTAAATCLSIGLYPIVSIDNGLTLPDSCGMVLEGVNEVYIEHAINKVLMKEENIIIEEIKQCKKYAEKSFSRSNFKIVMREYLSNAINHELI